MKRILLVLIAIAMLSACSKDGKMPKAEALTPADGQFIFNVADFEDGKVRYYSYNDGGKTIRFFLVQATDGIVRAAFDACDVCYRDKKGYRQDGNVVVCVNCNTEFALDQINHVEGGCNATPLNRSFRGEQVVISGEDVITGGVYF
jgi:uncharacterized membrane protein